MIGIHAATPKSDFGEVDETHKMVGLYATTPESIRYRKMISGDHEVAMRFLTGTTCNLNNAQALFAQGRITQREYNRYFRVWGNSAIRFTSAVQDRIFALGGMPALERRFARSRKLHQAWRAKVMRGDIGGYAC